MERLQAAHCVTEIWVPPSMLLPMSLDPKSRRHTLLTRLPGRAAKQQHTSERRKAGVPLYSVFLARHCTDEQWAENIRSVARWVYATLVCRGRKTAHITWGVADFLHGKEPSDPRAPSSLYMVKQAAPGSQCPQHRIKSKPNQELVTLTS